MPFEVDKNPDRQALNMSSRHLISISDPSTGAAIQVVPEDVMRAFGEVHKTFFRTN
jgi:hypothetical protein